MISAGPETRNLSFLALIFFFIQYNRPNKVGIMVLVRQNHNINFVWPYQCYIEDSGSVHFLLIDTAAHVMSIGC